MNWRKLTIVVMVPIILLGALYLLNPRDFWHSPWFLIWLAIGGLPFIFYPAIWAPDLYRQMNARVARPNRLLWQGLGFLFGAIIWFLVSAGLLTQYPALLGLTAGGNALVMILPCMFLAAVGIVLIGQRLSMWYLD